MKTPSDVIPGVELEPGARHSGVHPRIASHVPHVPSPACVVTLRSKHVFLPANELKRVKFERLRVLGTAVEVDPGVELEVGDGIGPSLYHQRAFV